MSTLHGGSGFEDPGLRDELFEAAAHFSTADFISGSSMVAV
jgi:hypothetical protein